ncbi:hypothetical protein ARMSODRAFT_1023667 [Armillaria solidipes]|uniref:F-box domain-containing protein n=1 Tax=Armillaria solidipes TaxID=1076256 RepID=A0A2H3AYJ8_9AGAR|nr:hypothetical protein ARMSODRAFT_1023667 [Armillaria solidipes]
MTRILALGIFEPGNTNFWGVCILLDYFGKEQTRSQRVFSPWNTVPIIVPDPQFDFAALVKQRMEVPEDILRLIFTEADIDDPRWAEELARVCWHFYGIARNRSQKRILIRDSATSRRSPEAAITCFSSLGWDDQ